jgi:formylglycine-generating enzyme required for sulfatase activity
MSAPSLNNYACIRWRAALCALAGVFAACTVAGAPDTETTVAVAGGTFIMGTPASEIQELKDRYNLAFPGVFENESPVHEVTLSNFHIDRYETSNARFAAFLAANPEWLPANVSNDKHNGRYLETWQGGQYPDGQDDHPVVFVTWDAAQSYCRWTGGRLPTEAEWEYVARAGSDREFPWGSELPNPKWANYFASDIGHTAPVGSYPPNDFGVYDLAGNVWEFLYDTWTDEYKSAAQIDPVAGGLIADEDIREVDGRRAVRGASYGGSVVNLRTRWRDSHVVSNAIEFVGFRCAYPQ